MIERAHLYEQPAQCLVALIPSGRLPPGTLLPPEPEFARQLGVSRQTVNQALVNLALRGLVARRP